MKNPETILIAFLISLGTYCQEKKVELVPDSLFYPSSKINETFVLSRNAPGIEIIRLPLGYRLPYKLYGFNALAENWITMQDIHNSIQAKVPGVSISSNTVSNQSSTIKMRRDTNTIVIVDGIRYDPSILNTLNPSDIEHITVASSAAATIFFNH